MFHELQHCYKDTINRINGSEPIYAISKDYQPLRTSVYSFDLPHNVHMSNIWWEANNITYFVKALDKIYFYIKSRNNSQLPAIYRILMLGSRIQYMPLNENEEAS